LRDFVTLNSTRAKKFYQLKGTNINMFNYFHITKILLQVTVIGSLHFQFCCYF